MLILHAMEKIFPEYDSIIIQPELGKIEGVVSKIYLMDLQVQKMQ